MREVQFTILGEPRGKGRPRFAKRGNFVKTYTPEETLNYEAYVKMCYIQAANGIKLEGAISANITCYYSVPKSVSKKKREEMLCGYYPCQKKPDLDNIIKSILDALNTIAFDDDKQITLMLIKKVYGDVPRIEVRLCEMETDNEEIH